MVIKKPNIDQNNFYLPVTKQNLDEDLSIAGKRSLTIPIGNVEITRKVKSLTIILRSCASVQMLTQTKKFIELIKVIFSHLKKILCLI